MSQLSGTMTFALSAEGRVVHINEVANGLACGCVCLKCGEKLVGRQGEIRGHHFSHYLASETASCPETALHRAAKEILLREMRVRLPDQLEGMAAVPGTEVRFERVSLEHRLGNPEAGTELVADAWGEGVTNMVIEIAVSHRVDPAKAEKLRKLGVCAMEIDLADVLAEYWDWQTLRHAVVIDPGRRTWVTLPEAEPDHSLVTESGPLSWRFRIRGSTVVARKLPICNVSVWHHINPAVRAVVEQACRGRGKWDPQYNNWVVFDHFWPEVRAILQAASTPPFNTNWPTHSSNH